MTEATTELSTAFAVAARLFAEEAHAGAKWFGRAQQPYDTHLRDVANLVRESGGDDLEIAAAYLHDVLEDTETTEEVLRDAFPAAVVDMVVELTDTAEMNALPPYERKCIQAMNMREASVGVRRIKMADQVSNLRGIVAGPIQWAPDKALTWAEGTEIVASACRGVCAELDAKYDSALNIATHLLRKLVDRGSEESNRNRLVN
jgi:guanosine-3',5'-bis(diphosphate) 3'-pyrophosphohydrolase